MRAYYFQIVPLLHPLRVSIAFTDTDSFLLIIECLYKECAKNIDIIAKLRPILDLSNYPKTSVYYNTDNAGQLGFFKDEMAVSYLSGKIQVRKFPMNSLFYRESKTYLILLGFDLNRTPSRREIRRLQNAKASQSVLEKN